MTIEQGTQDWNGRTVRGRDGGRLGRLTEVYPGERWGVVRSPLGMRRLVPLDGAEADGDRVVRVAADRASLRTAPDVAPGAPDAATETALRQHYTGRGVLADARAHQRQRFGGAKLGAAFFGWLVAVGVTVLLTGLLGGVAAALGSSTAVPPDASVTDAASVGVAVAALAVLIVAYFTGGYVAGRLARFDGSRNGFLSWVIGMLMTVAAVVVAAVAGSRNGALAQVRLPALPVSLEGLTVGTFVTLAVVVLGTLAAAVLGGAAGERFHSRVDRAATDVV